MNKLLTGLITCFYSMSAMAAGSSGGPLFPQFVTTLSTGIAYVWFTGGTRGGTIPACASNGTFFSYAFDTNTVGGRSMLANILASHATGGSMYFQGSGDCGVDPTTESLAQVHTGT